MKLSAESILADATGEELPSPVEISIGDEIIWSENTGRVSNGRMVGTVIAEKQTVTITWGVLDKNDVRKIEQKIPKGFIKMYVLGELLEVYRGTLNKVVLGYIGDGRLYYKSVSTDIVER